MECVSTWLLPKALTLTVPHQAIVCLACHSFGLLVLPLLVLLMCHCCCAAAAAAQTLGAAGSVQGVTVTEGNAATKQSGGSELRGSSKSVAGEKGLEQNSDSGDGSFSVHNLVQKGIGEWP